MNIWTAIRYWNGHGYRGWGSNGCRRVKGLRLRSSKQNCQAQGGKHDRQSDNRPFHFPSQIEPELTFWLSLVESVLSFASNGAQFRLQSASSAPGCPSRSPANPLSPLCEGRQPLHHCSNQSPRQRDLCRKQPIVAGMFQQPPARLHQALLQVGQRPTVDPWLPPFFVFPVARHEVQRSFA